MYKKFVFALVFVAAYAANASANGLESLENFVKTVKSGRSEFTQVVTVPPKEGQTLRARTSTGTFEFARPGHFRFVYRKPFEQTIVADGQTLWLHDVDLNQVTARKQEQVMGSTPAALVAAATDMKALQADFTLVTQPSQEGVDWVLATPRNKESSLKSVRIGFRGLDLAVLEIVDNFGQQSAMRFSSFVPNPKLDAATFQFKPPAGADVVRQ
jgi:outer membrane lipoprotein carrier protein